MLAAGPFVGCAGASTGVDEAPPGASGGAGARSGEAGVGNLGAGSSPAVSGGSSATVSGSSATGGNPFTNSGSSTGGTFFSTGGSSVGGAGRAGNAAGGNSSVGGVGGIGFSNEHGTLVANVADIAPGWFGIVGGLFFMGRDANGIYAMSMQCTHKFCALIISGTILDCPCHHSHFDHDGKVLMGPATTPLPHYAVFMDDAGNLYVDKFTVVSASTRISA